MGDWAIYGRVLIKTVDDTVCTNHRRGAYMDIIGVVGWIIGPVFDGDRIIADKITQSSANPQACQGVDKGLHFQVGDET